MKKLVVLIAVGVVLLAAGVFGGLYYLKWSKDQAVAREAKTEEKTAQLQLGPRDFDLMIAARSGTKWGFIDRTGHYLINPQFDEVGSRDYWRTGNTLVPVRLGDKWGYIEPSGRLAIATQYDAAQEFSGGLAAVRSGGLWGFVNPAGALVIPYIYNDAASFASGTGLAIVMTNGAMGVIDRSGRFVIAPQYVVILDVWGDNRLFRFVARDLNTETRMGFIDWRGQVVVPAQFEQLGALQPNGLAPIVAKQRLGFINASGAFVVPPMYLPPDSILFLPRNASGLTLVVSAETGKAGFIDRSGQVVIPLQFDGARPFSGNPPLALVTVGGRTGYIDTAGRYAIAPTFTGELGDFEAGLGLASYKVDGKIGFIDRSGRVVIAPQFDDVRPYCARLAAIPVKLGNLWGLIDNNGKYVVRPQFDALMCPIPL